MKKPDRGPKYREQRGAVMLREIRRPDLVKDQYRVRGAYNKPDGDKGFFDALNWRAARDKAADVNRNIEAGITAGTNEMQFGRVWREWFANREEDQELGEIRKATLANLKIRGGHAVAEYERTKIRNIKSIDVERWGKRLAARTSPEFAIGCVAHVRWALDYAVRKEYLQFNPLRQDPVKIPTKPREAPWIPTWEMMDQLIAFGERPRLRGYSRITWSNMRVGVALTAGASPRAGEVTVLEWRDIDFANRTISVRQSNSHHDGVGPTKSPASKRKVPMTQWVYEALLDHRAVLEKCGEARRNPRLGTSTSTTEGYVIRNRDHVDKPVEQTSWSQSFRRYLHAAGLRKGRDGKEDFRFHALRRFYPSALFALGTNPMEVAENIGHRDPSMTMKHYARALRDPPDIWRYRFQPADPMAHKVVDGVATPLAMLLPPPAHHAIKPDAPEVPAWVHEAIAKLQGGWRLRDVVAGICHGRTTLNFHLRKLGLPLAHQIYLDARDQRYAQLEAEGYTVLDIANLTGTTRSTVQAWREAKESGVPNTGKYLKSLKKRARPQRPVATDRKQMPLPL